MLNNIKPQRTDIIITPRKIICANIFYAIVHVAPAIKLANN